MQALLFVAAIEGRNKEMEIAAEGSDSGRGGGGGGGRERDYCSRIDVLGTLRHSISN